MRKSIEVIVTPTDILDVELGGVVGGGCKKNQCNDGKVNPDRRKLSAW